MSSWWLLEINYTFNGSIEGFTYFPSAPPTRVPVEPRIQDILHKSQRYWWSLSNDQASPSVLYQTHHEPCVDPLLAVNIYALGYIFILDSKHGITQWYAKPTYIRATSSMVPKRSWFYARSLVFVPWRINSLLVQLQRNYFSLPCQNPNIIEEDRDHYLVNMATDYGYFDTGKCKGFTGHYVHGDVKVMDLFKAVCGLESGESLAFSQYAEVLRSDTLELRWVCCRDVGYVWCVETQVTMRDVGWGISWSAGRAVGSVNDYSRVLWLVPSIEGWGDCNDIEIRWAGGY